MLHYASVLIGPNEATPVKGLVAITMATIGAEIFFLRVIKSLLPKE